MGHLVAAVGLLALSCFSPAQQQPAFLQVEASLDGRFGNVLGDFVELRRSGDVVTGTGRIGSEQLRLECTVTGQEFSGRSWLGSGEESRGGGRLDGELLNLRVGDCTWLLDAQVPIDMQLADLGPPQPDAERLWTVAIYMGGDNDLEDEAVNDLLEMQRGMPAKGCEVVVLIDRFDDRLPDDEWHDTRVLRVQPGDDGNFETLGTPRELDTGSGTTLASFVAGVFHRFPAKHHAVFVWDHGGGWTGICVDQQVPGSEASSMLDLSAIRRGLRTGMQAAGLARLDLVAFDACLMAQLEVALAVHDLADAMVASEAFVAGSGFPYDRVLPRLSDADGGLVLGRSIVDHYGEFYEGVFESGATLSAFDLRFAAPVADAIATLARQAIAASDTQWPALARALFFSESYQPRSERVADDAQCSIDLLDFAARLRGVPGIEAAAIDDLEARVALLVPSCFHGAERTLSRGLAIYGPHRAAQYRGAYGAAPLGRDSPWQRLLVDVHRRSAAEQDPLTVDGFRQLDAFGKPSTAASPFGGDRLLFTATGNSIVEVVVHDWRWSEDDGQWLRLRSQLVTDPLWPARWASAAAADMIDLVMPQFVAGRNELFHELTGFNFMITDGALQTIASIDVTSASTQAPITAVARHTAAATGEVQLVEVAFDRAEWFAVSMQPLGAAAAGAAPRATVPAAGDTFEFFLMARSPDGADGLLATPALTYGEQSLRLVAAWDPPGRYRAEMVARSMNGRTASGEHAYELVVNPDLAAWEKSWGVYDVADPSPLVGAWKQFKVIGPQQYQDLAVTCEVSAMEVSNLFQVLTTGGPDADLETRQFWNFEWYGLPCLRIVTQLADGRRFGWYGPVRLFGKNDKPTLAMKAINTSGVVWEWRKQ